MSRNVCSPEILLFSLEMLKSRTQILVGRTENKAKFTKQTLSDHHHGWMVIGQDTNTKTLLRNLLNLLLENISCKEYNTSYSIFQCIDI